MAAPRLAQDSRRAIMQVGSYRTDLYQVIDGTAATASTTVFTYDTVIRIDSYESDNWIKRATGSATAVDGEGMRLGQDKEITMLVYAGEVIATIGGKLNIVPVAK